MKISHQRIINVVGRKDSGKSGIIQFLIKELKNEGLRIGAIKQSSHLHALDKEGSDSDRFRAAGAVPTAFSTPQGFAIFYDGIPTEEQTQLWNTHFGNCDIVLVESFHEAEGPKLWLCSDQNWNEMPDQVIAVIHDTRVHPEIPTFKHVDKKLCAFLLSCLR